MCTQIKLPWHASQSYLNSHRAWLSSSWGPHSLQTQKKNDTIKSLPYSLLFFQNADTKDNILFLLGSLFKDGPFKASSRPGLWPLTRVLRALGLTWLSHPSSIRELSSFKCISPELASFIYVFIYFCELALDNHLSILQLPL